MPAARGRSLELKRLPGAARDYESLPSEPPDPVPRHFSIEIERTAHDRFRFVPHGTALAPYDRVWSFERRIELSDLRSQVEALRKVWNRVVDLRLRSSQARSERYKLPFQDAWDLKSSPEHLQRLGPDLARGGWRLFRYLFVSKDERESAKDTERRRRFATLLQEKSAARPLAITFFSDDLFVPWTMLYVHPGPGGLAKNGCNFVMNGFWGARHEIEHCTSDAPVQSCLESTGGQVRGGLHFDRELDAEIGFKVVSRQLGFFSRLEGIKHTERFFKRELKEALLNATFSDQIMYFFCHGVGSGDVKNPNFDESALDLTKDSDNEADYRITRGDLDDWLEEEGFSSGPFVFCNACQGGQMTTMFHEALPKAFLRKGAISLVGPQIDIPVVFAHQFAQRFFRQFVSKSERPTTVSSVMRRLAAEFFAKYKNPLGLTYSIYRGIDVTVNWRRGTPRNKK